MNTIWEALAEPFEADEVKFKPAVVSGNRCMALAYVDARVVMERLDSVMGPENWQDDYEVLADNSVVCRLRLKVNEEWVTKVDVGGPSEQPDGGDRMKAAFSDALKRAAVKVGVGRYLYSLPRSWADYNPQTRQIVNPPVLPEWARPARKPAAAPEVTQPPAKPVPTPPAQHQGPTNGQASPPHLGAALLRVLDGCQTEHDALKAIAEAREEWHHLSGPEKAAYQIARVAAAQRLGVPGLAPAPKAGEGVAK